MVVMLILERITREEQISHQKDHTRVLLSFIQFWFEYKKLISANLRPYVS